MNKQPLSHKITRLSWGSIELEGGNRLRDAKLFPGGSRGWDWRETGTQHSPGIQPADVEELLQNGARHLVLSKGMDNRLRVAPETLSMLEQKEVTVEILQTEAAVRRYNELRENSAVGGLFHSTC